MDILEEPAAIIFWVGSMFLLNADIHLPNTMPSVQVDHIHHYNDYSQAPRVYFRQKASTASLVTWKLNFPPWPFIKKTQVESRATQLSNHQALHYEEWLNAV